MRLPKTLLLCGGLLMWTALPAFATDLVLRISATQPYVYVGDEFAYMIEVDNSSTYGGGPYDSPNTILVDVLPPTLTFVDATTTKGECSADGQEVTCDLGTVKTGEVVAVTITVQATEPGTIINSVSVEGDLYDPAPGNNTASVAVEAEEKLEWTEPVTSGNQLSSGVSNDPVNTFTGELYFGTGPDLHIAGPMPLSFGRYYASMMDRDGRVRSALGPNWSHTYDWRLMRWSDTEVEVVTSRGRAIPFQKSGGLWEQSGALDYRLQLVEDGDGFIAGDPQTQATYHFDGDDRLVTIDGGHGVELTLTYNNDRLTSVSDGLGRSLQLTYAADQLITVSDGTRTVTFTYNKGRLKTVKDAAGAVTRYDYDAQHARPALLTSVVLPKGNTKYTQTFDEEGRVATQTDAVGNTHTFSYEAGGTVVTNPLGHTRTFEHDAAGRLVALTDEAGHKATFAYDGSGRRQRIDPREGGSQSFSFDEATGSISAVTRPDGTTTAYAYDLRTSGGFKVADLASITYPDGLTEQFTRDAAGNVVSVVDRSGQTWSYTYNALGQVASMENPLGGVTTMSYSGNGTLQSIEDPVGNTTQFVHDAFGRLVEVVHPDGSSRTYVYDQVDRLTSFTDERGSVTSFSYDENGNLSTLTDPAGKSTTFGYDDMDRLTSATDPLGNTDTRTYDALGRIAAMVDRSGDATQLAYDQAGFLSSITDAKSATWTFSHSPEGILTGAGRPTGIATSYTADPMGRLQSSSGTETASLGFDAVGLVQSATDAGGRTTLIERGADGRITSMQLPGGIEASYGRDAMGRLTGLTDPTGATWQYARDAAGRILSATDPLGNAISYTYNSRGWASSITLPGGLGSVTLTYDKAGAVEQIDFSNGPTLVFDRDVRGNLVEADGIELAYDANSRLIESNGLQIDRDVEERITAITFAPGKTVTFTYDARDLVTSVTDWLDGTTEFTYDSDGRLTNVSRPNGVETGYAYNDRDALLAITTGTLASIEMERDAQGRVLARTLDVPLPPVPESSIGGVQVGEGNRIDGFSYDALGRRLSDDRRTYEWDPASRLTGYSEGEVSTTFTYDAAGHILSSTSGDENRAYVWNYALGLPSIAVIREGGQDLTYYIHSPSGRLLYSIDAATGLRHFYHFDEAGSTLFLTDDEGEVAASYAYTPYGHVTGTMGEAENPFTYHGEKGVMTIGETGLYYMRARYYDAATRQFISPDPMWTVFPKATNPYQFAYGNPMELTDPLGLDVLMPAGPPVPQNPFGGDEGVVMDCGGQTAIRVGSDAQTIVEKAPAFVPDGFLTAVPETCPSPEPFTVSGFWETTIGLGFEILESGSEALAQKIVQNGIKSQNYNFTGASRLIRAKPFIKGCGMVVAAGISGFNEYQTSSSEGSSGGATTVRVVGSVGTDIGLGVAAGMLGPAGIVAGVADGFTGQNYSNTVKQIVRVPTVLMSDNRTQQNYVKNVKSGEYSCLVKETFEAGEVWAERGVLGTLDALGVAFGLWGP